MARLRQAWRQDIARSAAETRRDRRRSVKELKRELERVQQQMALRDRRAPESEGPDPQIDASRLRSLEARLIRLELATMADGRQADQVALWKSLSHGGEAEVEAHVRRAVATGTLQERPFAHMLVEELFPADFYELLLSSLPAPEFFPMHDGATAHLRPAEFRVVPRLTRLLWQYVDGEIAKAIAHTAQEALHSFIEARYRDFFGEGAAKVIGMPHEAFGGRLTLRRRGHAERAHFDPKRASAAMIINLARRDDPASGGVALYNVAAPVKPMRTTTYYPEDHGVGCMVAARVPLRPNSALILINSGAHAAYEAAEAPRGESFVYGFECYIGPTASPLLRLVSKLPRADQQPWIGLMAMRDE
jgi:hypothetical protein